MHALKTSTMFRRSSISLWDDTFGRPNEHKPLGRGALSVSNGAGHPEQDRPLLQGANPRQLWATMNEGSDSFILRTTRISSSICLLQAFVGIITPFAFCPYYLDSAMTLDRLVSLYLVLMLE